MRKPFPPPPPPFLIAIGIGMLYDLQYLTHQICQIFVDRLLVMKGSEAKIS
jgi:hypothetical protein